MLTVKLKTFAEIYGWRGAVAGLAVLYRDGDLDGWGRGIGWLCLVLIRTKLVR